MEKTANYGLPKWEKSDFIKMDDVNAAFGKIDETLKANADAAGGKAEALSGSLFFRNERAHPANCAARRTGSRKP